MEKTLVERSRELKLATVQIAAWEDMITDYTTETHSGFKNQETMPYEETAPTQSYDAIRDMAPEIQNLGRALLRLRPNGEIG